MDEISYMVRGRTKASCQRELDRLCNLLGARPTMPPTDGTGRGWIARAVPVPAAAPTGDQPGRGCSASG